MTVRSHASLAEGRGDTRTRIGDDAYDKYPEVIQQIVKITAFGRLGEASDVGAAIAAVLRMISGG
jgi:hypothetical protein